MLVDVQLSGSPVVVDGLDDSFVLELVRESEQQAREADRRKLRLAVHWAERHIVSDALDAAYWCDDDPRDFEETIGGAGTPLIGAGCVEPLAASLGVSSRTAVQLMSDGLDLRYRLPQVGAGVERLRIAPWRARRIAKLTHGLPRRPRRTSMRSSRRPRTRAAWPGSSGWLPRQPRCSTPPSRRRRRTRRRRPGVCAWTTTRARPGPAPPSWRSSATPPP